MGAAASVRTMDEKVEKENGTTCKICATSVNRFTRQKCEECNRYFCSKCMHVVPLFKNIPKRCKRCVQLLSGTLTRTELAWYTVQDLRLYLARRAVNTRNCFEKSDLIELVLQTRAAASSTPRGAADDPEHARHVQHLLERQRNDNAVSSNISSAATAPVPPPAQSATSLAGAVPPASIRSVPPPTQNHSTSSPASGRGGTPLRPQPPLRPQTPLRPQPPTYDNVMNPPDVTQRQGWNPNAVSDEHSQMEVDNSANGGASSGGASSVDSTQSPAAAGAADVGGEEEAATSGSGAQQYERAKLSSIKSREDIERLMIRQLKELLVTHYVDYKGCCEKGELVERVHRLWKETCRNQEIEPERMAEDDLCKICMDAVIDCLLLECGHMVTCTQCGKRMAECPVCRMYVSRVVHVFRA